MCYVQVYHPMKMTLYSEIQPSLIWSSVKERQRRASFSVYRDSLDVRLTNLGGVHDTLEFDIIFTPEYLELYRLLQTTTDAHLIQHFSDFLTVAKRRNCNERVAFLPLPSDLNRIVYSYLTGKRTTS